jgi:hypothetical protein
VKKIQIVLLILSIFLTTPIASAAIKPVKAQPIDYADITGPEMLKIKVDNSELNLKKKAALVKVSITISDDLNSVDSPNVYYSRLDSGGKITKGKLFSSKNLIRISSTKIEGRVIEVFEMTSTFPKGLTKGNYQLLTGDFRDLAGNRRTDLSIINTKYELLPVISVS